MSAVTIWHNPRCSKSRQALALLRDRGVEPEVREYLQAPPTREELEHVLGLLDMEPRQLMRRKEPPYAELQLGDPSLSRDQLVDAMVRHPILIERPVVIGHGAARLGRPPENVLELL
jgi:arsenate reductase (glutaredoxin)